MINQTAMIFTRLGVADPLPSSAQQVAIDADEIDRGPAVFDAPVPCVGPFPDTGILDDGGTGGSPHITRAIRYDDMP